MTTEKRVINQNDVIRQMLRESRDAGRWLDSTELADALILNPTGRIKELQRQGFGIESEMYPDDSEDDCEQKDEMRVDDSTRRRWR